VNGSGASFCVCIAWLLCSLVSMSGIAVCVAAFFTVLLVEGPAWALSACVSSVVCVSVVHVSAAVVWVVWEHWVWSESSNFLFKFE
jgi:hypothetical protein